MLFSEFSKRHIIAGPCALESRDQLKASVKFLKSVNIKMVRSCLWKPRTRPGWDGIGEDGVDMLLEESLQEGLIPATEILNSDHARAIVEGVERIDPEATVVLWLGARNQTHFEQRKIGQLLAAGPKNIHLMFKNQMWEDINHWMGIGEHIMNGGFPKERLSTCHRGFVPNKFVDNRLNLRNIPDFEMSMIVKEKLAIPMFFDPSHIGGSPENITLLAEISLYFDFDGYLVEVHPYPEKALTDSKQQLSYKQFEEFLKIIESLDEVAPKNTSKELLSSQVCGS